MRRKKRILLGMFAAPWSSNFLLLLLFGFGLGLSHIQSHQPEPIVVRGGRAIFQLIAKGDQTRIRTVVSGVRINELIGDKKAPHVFYAATEKGLLFTSDGGNRWTEFPWEKRTEVFAIAQSRNRLLVSTVEGVFVHEGGRWQPVPTGIPDGAIALTIQSCPSNADVLYAGTETAGVWKSTDGGRTWQGTGGGLPKAIGVQLVTPVRHLLVGSDCDVVYASTEADGIYKTTNGGASWNAATKGLPGPFAVRTYDPLLVSDFAQPPTIYTVIGEPVHSHLIVNRLFRTTDGENWEEVLRLDNNVLFRSLQINPTDPRELVLGAEEDVVRVTLPEGVKRAEGAGQEQLRGINPPPSVLAQDVGDIAVLIDEERTLSHIFDLDMKTFRFIPLGPRYRVEQDSLVWESDIGTKVSLGDEGAVRVELPFPFPFYGQMQPAVFVNANGNITFVRRDDSRAPSLTSFAQRSPRIAALWTDLNPAAAGETGGIFLAAGSDRLVVTWKGVPEFGKKGINSFQIVLQPNGTITMSYNGVASLGAIVGISPGAAEVSSVARVNFSSIRARVLTAVPIAENFDGEFDIQAIGRAFYQTHPDNFDFLVAWGASSLPRGVAGQALAFYAFIQNDTQGIGFRPGRFNGGPEAFGSRGRIQGFLNMNRLSIYPAPPNFGLTFSVFGQETGHRWGAFVRFRDGMRTSDELLGRDLAHWSLYHDTDASVLEGVDWRDNGDGTFSGVGITSRYSALDQYLMGLRPPGEVTDFFFIRDPSPRITCGGDPALQGRDCDPSFGLNRTISGTRVTVSVNQVIEAEGPRVPAFGQAPTSFTQAFVLIVPPGMDEEEIQSDIKKLDQIRQAWEEFFTHATERRATITTRLRMPPEKARSKL
jgi:photosystem II stability/assembly factor-like uncharacterized protein